MVIFGFDFIISVKNGNCKTLAANSNSAAQFKNGIQTFEIKMNHHSRYTKSKSHHMVEIISTGGCSKIYTKFMQKVFTDVILIANTSRSRIH